MDDINYHFLNPSALSNVTANKEFIKGVLIKFIDGPNQPPNQPPNLLDALKKNKDSFLQVNIAVFKALEFFIFYKLGYDYTNLQKVKRYFYRYLYVADKLIQMYDDTKTTEDYYTKAFRRLFQESNNFARKMSNPLIAKVDEKINGFFDSLQKALIDPSRITRHKYNEELSVLDKKVVATQMMLSASEQQDLKVTNGIKNLLRQYSDEPKTTQYIVNKITALTEIKPASASSVAAVAVGGKAKRRQYRRRMLGGGNLKDNIVGYLNGIYNFDEDDIKPVRHGRYKVGELTDGNFETGAFNKKVLPEVSALIGKYNSEGSSNLYKILYADKIIKKFELATTDIVFTDAEQFTKEKNAAKNKVSDQKNIIYKLDPLPSFKIKSQQGGSVKNTFITGSSDIRRDAINVRDGAKTLGRSVATGAKNLGTRVANSSVGKTVAKFVKDAPTISSGFSPLRGGANRVYVSSSEQNRRANNISLQVINEIDQFITVTLHAFINIDTSKISANQLNIIKSKYEKNQFIAIDKRLEALV